MRERDRETIVNHRHTRANAATNLVDTVALAANEIRAEEQFWRPELGLADAQLGPVRQRVECVVDLRLLLRVGIGAEEAGLLLQAPW